MKKAYVLKKISIFVAVIMLFMLGPDMNITASASGHGFILPLDGMNLGSHVTSGFRTVARPNHNGIDSAWGGILGTPIRAVKSGKVIISNWDKSGGWYVAVDHGDSLKTAYAHMNTKPIVSVGQKVTQGQVLGYVGSTGQSTGPHLHFEVRTGSATSYWKCTPVNPVTYLRGATSFGKIPEASSISITLNSITKLSQKNAQINATFHNLSGAKITGAGFQIGTSPGQYFTTKQESANLSMTTVNAWYDMNKWIGELIPGKTYYYRVFAVSNNLTFYSAESSFTTASPPASPSPTTPTTYTINVTSAVGGSVSGGGTYTTGSNVTVMATAKAGYSFDGWYEGSSRVSTNTSYSFTPKADRTLQARWTQNSLSNWVPASSVPSGAQIVNRKWTHTHTQSSVSSSLPKGYYYVSTTYGAWSEWSVWQNTSTSNLVDPFERSQLLLETRSQYIQPITESQWTFYRWVNEDGTYAWHNNKGLSGTINYTNKQSITLDYELSYKDTTTDGYNYYGNYVYAGNTWLQRIWFLEKKEFVTIQDGYSQWSFRTRNATYTYRRDNIETTTAPSGNGISNIKEYVRYII